VTSLWEILVPCVRNDGRPFRVRYHRVWDAKVRAISGGLTIMKPARGQWIDPREGQLYEERMIPVRFVATRDQMEEIVDMTCVYYEQLAVLCYRIADEVVYREIDDAQRSFDRRKNQANNRRSQG
jgi:hypothetical protein